MLKRAPVTTFVLTNDVISFIISTSILVVSITILNLLGGIEIDDNRPFELEFLKNMKAAPLPILAGVVIGVDAVWIAWDFFVYYKELSPPSTSEMLLKKKKRRDAQAKKNKNEEELQRQSPSASLSSHRNTQQSSGSAQVTPEATTAPSACERHEKRGGSSTTSRGLQPQHSTGVADISDNIIVTIPSAAVTHRGLYVDDEAFLNMNVNTNMSSTIRWGQDNQVGGEGPHPQSISSPSMYSDESERDDDNAKGTGYKKVRGAAKRRRSGLFSIGVTSAGKSNGAITSPPLPAISEDTTDAATLSFVLLSQLLTKTLSLIVFCFFGVITTLAIDEKTTEHKWSPKYKTQIAMGDLSFVASLIQYAIVLAAASFMFQLIGAKYEFYKVGLAARKGVKS